MRVHFVTFATPAFRARQWLLESSARRIGHADVIESWTPHRLAADGFLDRHADLFPGSKGFGWYAWKPYVILQALAHADDGDLVIYQDVGRRQPILIRHRLDFWAGFLANPQVDCVPGVLIPWWGPNRQWTKRAVMQALMLDEPRYQDCPQVQASWSVWRKCEKSLNFVREWSDLCGQRAHVSGDLEHGQAGEVPGFVEHRWDQSLLTLMSWRDHLQPLECGSEPPAGFNEKSIDDWMLRLGAPAGPAMPRLAIQSLTHTYLALEHLAKLLFLRTKSLGR